MSSRLPELAILISGRGSNMLALASACQTGELPARVSLVVSNCPDAAGLESAQAMGIRTAVVDHREFADRSDFDLALHLQLQQVNPDWVVLAGFMRILGKSMVDLWKNRIINIHPSLLPKYPGLDTHARAIQAGDHEAGATVHLVTASLDDGPILGQVRVPIRSGDTPDTLAARVLTAEHRLYVDVLKQCVTGNMMRGPLQ